MSCVNSTDALSNGTESQSENSSITVSEIIIIGEKAGNPSNKQKQDVKYPAVKL